MLNLLERFDIEGAGQSSANHLHFTAEAQKIAFADRAAYVADPDFEDVPTKELISKDYADERDRSGYREVVPTRRVRCAEVG